jgi:uncharacterized membrane protein
MDYHLTTAVDASPEEIWALFTDVERWPAMNQSIRELHRLDSGPLHVGSEVIIKQMRLPRVRWRVTELAPGRSFSWESATRGVIAVGGHMVHAAGPGSTITITLETHGPMARLTHALTGNMSQRYLSMEIEGFRQAAEAGRR